MLRAMDSAVAGLRAHQSKLDVIGHNIANVNTYGFKSQSYSFKEAMYQTTTPSTGGTTGANATGGVNAAQYGYGSLTGSIATDMTASTPTYVGGFSATINAEGFFITLPTLKTIDLGDTAATKTEALKSNDLQFTRVGMFNIDSNGYMVDSNGNFVYGFRATDATDSTAALSENMQALRAPSAIAKDGKATYTEPGEALLLKDISINSLGEVTATVSKEGDTELDGKTITLGKVAIASFQNPQGLTKAGDIYYTTNTADNAGVANAAVPGGSTSDLMTGYVEASNVDLAKEFSDMITTQRGFQANAKIITVSDEVLAELISMKR